MPKIAPQPGHPAERILIYGGSGSGKTKAWLDIAQAYHDSDLEGTFYVLDTDYAVERMVYDGYKDLLGSDRIQVTVPYEGFSDYQSWARELKKVMTKNDWAVVDLMDVSWEEAQNYYSEQVYGEDKGSYFVARRKEMKNPNKEQLFEGSNDWTIIKPLYETFSKNVFYNHKGHTLVTTGAAAVSRSGAWGDSKEILSTFGHVGMKPTGNKRLMHNVHTAILMVQERDGWVMTSAKDRERELLKNVGIDDFAVDYIKDVAGWKPKKKKMTAAERKAARAKGK